MSLRAVYQNFFIASASRLITAVIGLVIIGILTRHLGQSGYGAYETILSYLFIFTVLADLGLHIIHVREISREPENEKFISGNIFTLRLASVISVAALAGFVGIFLPYPQEIKSGIFIAALFVIFSSLSQILAGIFQKYNTFYLVSASDFLTRVVQLALVWLAARNGLGLLSFTAILSLTAASQFFLIFYLSRKHIRFSLVLNFPYVKKILKSSLPIAFSILFTAIYIRTDALMLSLMKSTADVGIYRLPAKLLETIVFFPALLVELSMPSFSYLAIRTKDLFTQNFKKIFNFLVMSAAPVVVYLVILPERVVLLLGGQDFLASALPLRILALIIGLVFLNNLSGKILITLDLQKSGMWIYFSGAILNVFLNFIFIPKYSYLGAAWTTFLTEILVTIMLFSILYRKTSLRADFGVLPKVLAAGAVMGAVVFQLKESLFLIPPLAGGAAYLLILFALKGFTKDDLKKLISVAT